MCYHLAMNNPGNNGRAVVVSSQSVVLATKGDNGDWTAETREAAYQLWAWECEQSAVAVAKRLEVSEFTVRYWSRQDGWRLRYEQERSDLDPSHARPAIAVRLQDGAMSGASFLSAVASGLMTGPDIDDILADERLNVVDKRLKIDARLKSYAAARKDRIHASKILLDAAGFAGVRVTGSEYHHDQPKQTEAINYDTLSNADLADVERRLRLSSRSSTNGAS